jgi:macrolide-specific efflux system membrane fusion protein
MTHTNCWKLVGCCLAAALAVCALPTTQSRAQTEGKPKQAADEEPAAPNIIRVPSRVEGVIVELGPHTSRGEKVEKGQLLARVDDEMARIHVHIAEANVDAAKAGLEAARLVMKECEARFRNQEKLASSKEDVRAAQLLWDTKAAEEKRSAQLVKIAELELMQAKLRLDMHHIRSPAHGRIAKINKRPGEAVGALETVIVIAIPEEK